MNNQPRPVLVTGGNGYLGSWLVALLLERGHPVRTTVRGERAGAVLRAAVEARTTGEKAENLDIVVADLREAGGWPAAVRGMQQVVHVASPIGAGRPREMIATARAGIEHVLGAAARAGVQRVILTSSEVTAGAAGSPAIADGRTWAPVRGKAATAYRDAKILAERDAWQLADRGLFELTSILPGFLQGPPILNPSLTGSIGVVGRLLDGSLSALPNVGWNIADVRDVAEAHIRALAAPSAGERLVVSGRFLWWREIADLLRERFPRHADHIPTRTMPDVIARLAALVSRDMAMIRPDLGRRVENDCTTARRLIGWRPREVDETIADTARAFLDNSAGR